MRKLLICLLFAVFEITAVNAAGYSKEEWKALTQGADFNVILKVVDDEGTSVQGAKVSGWIFIDNNGDHGKHYSACADKQGRVDIKGRCGEWVSVVVQKDGYYTTRFKIKYPNMNNDKRIDDGKWQPYGEPRVVVLKKIKEVGQLVVPDKSRRTRIELKIPEYDRWIPFDLEKYDWVAPYGLGECSDVMLRFRNRSTTRWYDYTDCMDVCFTNNPYAGAYEMKKDMTSDMHTVYEANPNAEYKNWFEFKSEQTSDRKKTNDYLQDDSYFVYRIRTKVDEEGNLKSAHYGVIDGKWMSAKKIMIMSDGCFNPEENDYNIEDGYYLREKVKYYNDETK